MPPNLWSLYGLMLKSRLFEEAIAKLWHEGAARGVVVRLLPHETG